jgi:hypothetical protein
MEQSRHRVVSIQQYSLTNRVDWHSLTTLPCSNPIAALRVWREMLVASSTVLSCCARTCRRVSLHSSGMHTWFDLQRGHPAFNFVNPSASLTWHSQHYQNSSRLPHNCRHGWLASQATSPLTWTRARSYRCVHRPDVALIIRLREGVVALLP